MNRQPLQTLNRAQRSHRRVRSAFTLIDVLVSIAVIAVLVGLLVPSLASVNEAARRVVCQSNVRQIGLGLVMYADDYQGFLPPSVFLPTNPLYRASQRPQDMILLRVPPELVSRSIGTNWDGTGLLYANDYLPAQKVFYCPSHRGENSFKLNADRWRETDTEVVGNYHFRGAGPIGRTTVRGQLPITTNLYRIDPAQSSLLADGMRVRSDYNHDQGANFFRADLTIHWFPDPDRRIPSILGATKFDTTASQILQAWEWFDEAANAEQGG